MHISFPEQSDLSEIKSVAKLLAYAIPLEPADARLNIFCTHPYTETLVMPKITNGSITGYYDLTKKEDSDEWLHELCIHIDRIDSIDSVFTIIRTPYLLTLLRESKSYLSLSDFSRLLADSWIREENPNADINVPISQSIKWFKTADKQVLMTEDEYAYYNSLPDTLTLYRGVARGRNKKGLSWTQSYDTVEWFSHRFDSDTRRGYILKVETTKDNVLAYFNRRDEDEIVLDVRKINGVEKIEWLSLLRGYIKTSQLLVFIPSFKPTYIPTFYPTYLYNFVQLCSTNCTTQ